MLATILLLAAAAVVVLILILSLFKKQNTRLREEIAQTGESIIIEPNGALYQGGNSFISLKTYGVIMLTDHRIIFRKPVGADIEVMLSQVTKVSESEWFRGNWRSGQKFLILENQRGIEKGFIVREPDRWVREITALLSQK